MNLIILISLLIAGHAVSQTIDELIKQATPQMTDENDEEGEPIIKLELDILYAKKDYAALLKAMLYRNPTKSSEDSNSKRSKRKATNFEHKRWTDKEIPYWIETSHFTENERDEIYEGIDEWNSLTCLKLLPRKEEYNYVHIRTGSGCGSYVGMNGGVQSLILGNGCRIKRIVVHELGHAVGFQHEHTRPDRDNFVRIIFENIEQGMVGNFNQKTDYSVNTYGIDYDYGSVMHYGSKFFSANGKNTIETIAPSWQNRIGKAPGLSFADLKLANIMYDCGGHCQIKSCPNNGYVDKYCNCMCQGPTALDPLEICTSDIDKDAVTEDDTDDVTEDDNEEVTEDDNDDVTEDDNDDVTEDDNDDVTEGDNDDVTEGDNDDVTEGDNDNVTEDDNNDVTEDDNDDVTEDDNEGATEGGNDDVTEGDNDDVTEGDNVTEDKNEEVTEDENIEVTEDTGNGEDDEECIDYHPYCHGWASRGYCESNPLVMNANCKKSCKQCMSNSDVENEDDAKDNEKEDEDDEQCIDYHSSCPGWARWGYCETNPLVMNANCRKSCKQC